MTESSLSPQEKAYNHVIGRILNSHVSEIYPLTTAFFKLNEVYFEELEIIIDQANEIMVSQMHSGSNIIQAREYAVSIAYETCEDKFLELEENFSKEKESESPFDINTSGYIDSTQLN